MRILFLAVVIASLSLANAQPDEFAAAKQLVESKADCGTLSDAQLEQIGDYLMERLHPGAAHGRMEAMMGGEGSESLKRAHIQMAQALYCGRSDTPLTYGGMMGIAPMMGRFGGYGPGGFGGGMMNYGNIMGYGDGGWAFGLLFRMLAFIALALLVYWLYRSISGGGQGVSAVDVLGQRYAKGEISKKLHAGMKKSGIIGAC
ncbi:hypothetical protein HY095_02340 [Candidatus Micrarchaeota archaeon]|nr:hypothetical protein [Candidatus Micrarchaeota archaeon]